PKGRRCSVRVVPRRVRRRHRLIAPRHRRREPSARLARRAGSHPGSKALSRRRQSATSVNLLFGPMLGYANHRAPYAEPTVPSGEALGNLSQAFTDLALISAALQPGPGGWAARRGEACNSEPPRPSSLLLAQLMAGTLRESASRGTAAGSEFVGITIGVVQQ